MDTRDFSLQYSKRDKPLASVIIPTYNPGEHAKRLASALSSQTVPFEVIIIDSGTHNARDLEPYKRLRSIVIPIQKHQFHHAKTRNQAASHSTGEILVFLTQDAIPQGDSFIENLIKPITFDGYAATFARQIPRRDASPLEKYSRKHNYPDAPYDVTKKDIDSLGVRAFFFSNSASAINKHIFHALGGFPTHTIMNEDMLIASRLLRANQTLRYTPEAVVEHSHNYRTQQTFRRYVDIGVVFDQALNDLKGANMAGEGLQYALNLIRYLIRTKHLYQLPAAALEIVAKGAGLWIGKRHRHIPKSLLKRISMHAEYWK